jgi:hypothetical protein
MQHDLWFISSFFIAAFAFFCGFFIGHRRDLVNAPTETLLREIIARRSRSQVAEVTAVRVEEAVTKAVDDLTRAVATWSPTTPPPKTNKFGPFGPKERG